MAKMSALDKAIRLIEARRDAMRMQFTADEAGLTIALQILQHQSLRPTRTRKPRAVPPAEKVS